MLYTDKLYIAVEIIINDLLIVEDPSAFLLAIDSIIGTSIISFFIILEFWKA